MKEVHFTDIYVDDVIVNRVTEVLRSTRYVKGDLLSEFESRFADQCDVDYAVGVNSGTAAILLSLQATGVGEGDDVFVPGHTFFATASPALTLGADLHFVDIDPETYTMDLDDLASKLDEADSPTAVLPVHIYGQMADMDAILSLAADYDLTVVEDACQAHFAERDGFTAGAGGDAGAFSFYPSKNMTVGGDGGMLVTDNKAIAKKARALRNHGRNEQGVHERLGLNFRMDEIKAAVGIEQLNHIREWNSERRRAARKYERRLTDVDEVVTPSEALEATHVYHLYVIQVPDRDALRRHLDSEGIQTGIHYETPAHEHPAVVREVGEHTLSTTEALCEDIVSLPMHPRIEEWEIDAVCDTIQEYYT